MKQAIVKCRAVTVVHEGEPFLYVELTIDCDLCGKYSLYLAGHHLKPVVGLLQEVIDQSPQLTDEGNTKTLYRHEWMETVNYNPEDN